MAKHEIERDTPIMPAVIADTVVDKVAGCYNLRIGRKQANKLVAKQARLYSRSAAWRKKMRSRGNKGRDLLYSFMQHWLASDLKKAHPRIAMEIGEAAWYGTPLRCKR